MSPNIDVGRNQEAKPDSSEIQFTHEPTVQPPVEPEEKKPNEAKVEPAAPVVSSPDVAQKPDVLPTVTVRQINPAHLTRENINQEPLNIDDAAAMTEAVNQISESSPE